MSRKLENYERILLFVVKNMDNINSYNVFIGIVDDLKEGYKMSRHRPIYMFMSDINCNFMSKLDDNFIIRYGAKLSLEAAVKSINKFNLNKTHTGGIIFNEICGTFEYLDTGVLNMIDDFNNIKDHNCVVFKEFISRQIVIGLLKRINDLEGVIENG